MTFINPTALWGLLALSVPILVHLFHFRRYTTVYFSDVRLLSQMEEQRSTKSNLKRLLLLFLRMAAIFFVVMAFAQPVFDEDNPLVDDIARHEILWIDNSLSMYDGEASSYDQTVKELTTYLNNSSGDQRFQVLGHEEVFDPNLWYGKDSALSLLRSMEPVPFARSLNDRWQEILPFRDSLDLSIKIFTDGQRNFLDTIPGIDSLPVDLFIQESSKSSEDAATIDSVWWVDRPTVDNRSGSLAFALQIHQEDIASQVVLSYGSVTLDSLYIPMDTIGLFMDTLEIEVRDTGWLSFTFALRNDPNQYNNSIPLGIYLPELIDILVVSEDPFPKSIKALKSVSDFTIGQTNLSGFMAQNSSFYADYEVIILESVKAFTQAQIDQIAKLRNKGLRLIILPSASLDAASYDDAFAQWDIPLEDTYPYRGKVNELNTSHYLLDGVLRGKAVRSRFPEVYDGLTWRSTSAQRTTPIYTTLKGDVLLFSCQSAKGASYVFTSSMDKKSSNLMEDPLFAPLLYRMAMVDASDFPAYKRLDYQAKFILPNTMVDAESPVEFRTLTKTWIPRQSKSNDGLVCAMDGVAPGHLLGYQNSSKRFVMGCALSRAEADSSFWTVDELSSWLASSSVTLRSEEDMIQHNESSDYGNGLWRWILLIVLVSLLGETLIVRLFSRS
ncbi:MAG: BatA domain-containing protein [Bacteroidota bacterium]|nr:BatA domain-containing protein [Bacteroidota bacterium]